MKRFILSRKTVLSLIILLLCLVLVSYIIPQRMSVSEIAFQKWRTAHPVPAKIADALGLHHLYTTFWFTATLCMSFLSLIFSSIQQFSLARQRTFQPISPAAGNRVLVSAGESEVKRVMKREGYLRLKALHGEERFVKHPWGYWGNFMLHLGFLLVIASSILILFTQKRAIIRLEDGETILPGTPWSVETHGLLTEELILPMPVHLSKLNIDFWETDDMREMKSVIKFLYPDRHIEEIRLRINEPVWHTEMKWYQTPDAGDNFYLEFIDAQGRKIEQSIMFMLPLRRDVASYNNFRFDWMPFMLKGKYYADAEKKSMVSRNPLLVLRLYDGDNLIGERPLRIGESGNLGGVQVRLLRTARWTGILISSTIGMSGIFTGFFIIIIGAAIAYFTPQREFRMKRDDAGVFLTWECERFEGSYKEEYEGIVKTLGGTIG